MKHRGTIVDLSSKYNQVEDLAVKLDALEYHEGTIHKLDLSHNIIDANLVEHVETALANPVEKLDLSHTELKYKQLKYLSDSLNHVTHLDLSNNQLTSRDVGPIVSLMCYSYDLVKLNISKNSIEMSGLIAILGALPLNTNLKSLQCASIDTYTDSGRFLVTHLANNTTLTSLDLSSNGLLNTEHHINNMTRFIKTNSAVLKLKLKRSCYASSSSKNSPIFKPFIDALRGNRTLMVLDLSECDFGTTTSVIMLLDALTVGTNLVKLKLANTNLNDEHAFYVARLISCNPRLTYLNVAWNQFDDGVIPILKALAFNTTLTRFKMSDVIQGDSIRSLLAVILQNTILKKLYTTSISSMFCVNFIRTCLKHNTTLMSIGTVRHPVLLDSSLNKLLQRNQTLAAQKNITFTDLLVMAPPSQVLSKNKTNSKKQRTL